MSDQWTSCSTPRDDVRRLQPEVLAHLRVRTPPAGPRARPRRRASPRSSSKRRMMCRQYVTSSASTRRNDGCTLFSARWKRLERRRRRTASGNSLLQPRVEEAPRREAAADEVLPHAALRLVERRRDALRERRARVRAGRPGARRCRARTRAGTRGSRAGESSWKCVVSRMSVGANDVANGCTVVSSRHAARSIPHALEHREREPRCASRGKRPRRHESSTGSASATARISGTSAALRRSKIALDLGRLHARLVVVEHDVVRVAVAARSRRRTRARSSRFRSRCGSMIA